MLGALGVAALGTAGLAGCVGTPGGIQAPDSWTVMTYEIADTNLEPFLITDIEEMGRVGTRPGLNMVSFVDRAEGYTDVDVLGLPDWTGAKVLEIGQGSAEVLADLGDVNTGDPDILAGFIRESIRAYPAANYALIISDHGASWPGVGGDESADHDVLTLEELDQAIGQGLADGGVDKLDLLGFDACLMATYEVASTMAPLADRLLASQELEPGHGWNYISLEAAYRGATVDELGSALIEGFRSQAVKEETENEITLSLIDLTQMDVVDEALTTFATALTDRVDGIAPSVGRTLAETLGFGTNPDPRYDVHMKDLAILAGEIGVDALDVADEADALVRAINDAIVDKVDGQATRGATGLSIYFPPEGALYNDAYAAVAEETGWADFLGAYYQAGSQIPPDELPDFVTNDATIEFVGGGLSISGQFGVQAETNIADAYIQYGIVNDDGSISLIGDEPAEVSADGTGTASGFYDLTYLTISDGVDTSSAYLSYSLDEAAGTATVDVPISYYPPDGSGAQPVTDALLSLGLSPSTGSIVSEVYYAYNPDSGTYGELTVESTGLIVPLVQNLYPDGSTEWVPTNDVGLYAQLANLQYALEPLESGTQLYVELWVVDFGGNSDFVNAVVTVP
jgi:hypothetical protein